MNKKVAAAVFINEKKELLLYLRDNKKTIPFPNYWDLVGGHFKKNETPIQALKREVKEEIGINIAGKNLELLGIVDDLIGNDVYIYKSKITKKIGELTLKEGQRLGYFNFEEVIKIKIPAVLKEFFIKNKNKIFSKN